METIFKKEIRPEEEIKKYIRVGVDYYKIIETCMGNGKVCKDLKSWSYTTLVQDGLKEHIPNIPKYDTFVNVPEHIKYRKEINGGYNKYHKLSHHPQKGDFPNIKNFLEHIFGEQIELGYDYLQLLYLQPKQKLPVLLLVSKERNTGKTTFLQFLGEMFENNVVFCSAETIRNNFNSYWATRLIACCDEMTLKNKGDYEMIKNYTTQMDIKLELKGREAVTVPFYCKFVFCSNDEDSPVTIETGEDRYWVRKVSVIQNLDPDYMNKLKVEIPAFLYHLKHREISVAKSGRLYFSQEMIETEEARAIMRNGTKLKDDIILLLKDILEKTDIERYCFCIGDVTDLLYDRLNIQYNSTDIRKILKSDWDLSPYKYPTRYKKILYDKSKERYEFCDSKGRCYQLKRKQIECFLQRNQS